MKSLKERLYNYEEAPPMQSWALIAVALDNEAIHATLKKKTSKIFYLSVAAAVTILIFSIILWMVNSSGIHDMLAGNGAKNKTIDTNSNISPGKITVPQTGDDDAVKNSIKNTGKSDMDIDNASSQPAEKKYLTISGPQGEHIKISSKAASLIVSSDDQNPPNLVWSEKVNKWKDIMKTHTLAPTTANFLDIVELTEAVTINK